MNVRSFSVNSNLAIVNPDVQALIEEKLTILVNELKTLIPSDDFQVHLSVSAQTREQP